MATPDTRQRRAPLPPSQSHSQTYLPTTPPPPDSRSTPSLLSLYRSNRTSASLPTRLAFHAADLALLTLALFLAPLLIHTLVTSLNALSELAGRRARTSLEDIPTRRVALGGAVLLVWHAVIAGLTYGTVRKRDGAWARWLSRVVVPGWLVGGVVLGGWMVVGRMGEAGG